MEHEKYIDLISDERDGLLSDGERAELTAHLAGCGDCRAAKDRWQGYAKTLFAAPAKPSAEDSRRFARIVMARIRQESPMAPSWWTSWSLDRWLVPALSAGVVAAALLIALAPSSQGPALDEALLLSECHALTKWCVRSHGTGAGRLLLPSLED